jgi:hypothetical protein
MEESAKHNFNFDFEKNDRDNEMSDAEVRAHMFQEVCLYRPVADDKIMGGTSGPGHKGGDEGKMDVEDHRDFKGHK